MKFKFCFKIKIPKWIVEPSNPKAIWVVMVEQVGASACVFMPGCVAMSQMYCAKRWQRALNCRGDVGQSNETRETFIEEPPHNRNHLFSGSSITEKSTYCELYYEKSHLGRPRMLYSAWEAAQMRLDQPDGGEADRCCVLSRADVEFWFNNTWTLSAWLLRNAYLPALF